MLDLQVNSNRQVLIVCKPMIVENVMSFVASKLAPTDLAQPCTLSYGSDVTRAATKL